MLKRFRYTNPTITHELDRGGTYADEKGKAVVRRRIHFQSNVGDTFKSLLGEAGGTR